MAFLAADLGLPVREAIEDAIHRSVFGLDATDQKAFESAWHKDAVFIYNGMTPVEGLDAILANTFGFIGAGLDTTHSVSNVRVEVKDGANTAKMTAHAIAMHYRRGEGQNPKASFLMTGNMYFLDVAKDESDGLWKIKKLDLRVNWFNGDLSVVGA